MDQLKEGSTFENRFEVLRFLGGGGMGAVYKANQQDAKRIVALKLLHPSVVETAEFRKRFLRECKLLSQLASEHIITFYHAAISSEGYPYAVFEYLEGQTLRQLLSSNGRLTVPESLQVLIQMSTALQSAHALGIVHRDLKPENIMINKRADTLWVKVFDFGLSKSSITEERESQKLTLTGDLVGTAAYMSPEQCRGQRADSRADVYALGCIAFECLSGKQLFDEDSPMAALHKHLNEDPAKAVSELYSHCPPALTELIESMLAKSPSARPRSMSTVRDALIKAQSQLQQGILSSKIRRRRRRSIPLAIGAVVFLALLACPAIFFLVSSQQDQLRQKNKIETAHKRAKKAELDRRSLSLASDLADAAAEALLAQNYAKTIEYATKCVDLKNSTCAIIPIKLRTLVMLTQAANFSQLADPDPSLSRMSKLLAEAKAKHCLSEGETSHWTLKYLLLAANVNHTKERYEHSIALTLEYEKLHNAVPDDQKEQLPFLLMLVSRGHSYRNTHQFEKALLTDRRALKIAKELQGEGTEQLHSIYPSLFFDIGIGNASPKEVADLQVEYAKAFEEGFSSINSEGMMRSILAAQDNVLGHPQYVGGSAPIILEAWKAAEMFPEVSTHLRARALQQLLHLRARQTKGGKIDSKTLRQLANSYLRILEQAKAPSIGSSYPGSRSELAHELEALLIADSQTSLAAKVKKANENFHFDK